MCNSELVTVDLFGGSGALLFLRYCFLLLMGELGHDEPLSDSKGFVLRLDCEDLMF